MFGSGMGGMGGMGGGGPQQKKEPTPVFLKDDPSGVVPLGKAKFPDARAKHAWLLLFYDKERAEEDPTTRQRVALAKKLSAGVLKKAKGVKNGMIFKVGAVDCSGGEEALRFCRQQLAADDAVIPAFATVLDGSVDAVTDAAVLGDARKLHDHVTAAMLHVDTPIVNVNSLEHVRARLLAAAPAAPRRPTAAVLLLTDKYETSPLYASLAYRHRRDGFAAFGESRGASLDLAKAYGVKKYPTLLVLVKPPAVPGLPPFPPEVRRYEGAAMDAESLSAWLDKMAGEFLGSRSDDKRRKKQKARS